MDIMSDLPTIYRLDPDLDNPRYSGFGFADRSSVRGNVSLASDFGPDNILENGRSWSKLRFDNLWPTPQLTGRANRNNDYPCVGLTVPLFSGRAVDALYDLLAPNGEVLPTICKSGNYFAFNCLRVIAVLERFPE
jgi:hypothetical protein